MLLQYIHLDLLGKNMSVYVNLYGYLYTKFHNHFHVYLADGISLP